MIENVKVSFFYYPYPFIEKTIMKRGVFMADIVDIASMKVIDICQRGTKKDFIDFYFILQHISFRDVILNLIKRYGSERINPVNLGKSFVYFADADIDPDVVYCGSCQPVWNDVKKIFKKNIKSWVYQIEVAL